MQKKSSMLTQLIGDPSATQPTGQFIQKPNQRQKALGQQDSVLLEILPVSEWGLDFSKGKYLRLGKVFGFWNSDQLSKTVELLQPYFDVWGLFKAADFRKPLSIIKNRLTQPSSSQQQEESVIDDTSLIENHETNQIGNEGLELAFRQLCPVGLDPGCSWEFSIAQLCAQVSHKT